jgi:bisanhydrobacterioruberin hydratase
MINVNNKLSNVTIAIFTALLFHFSGFIGMCTSAKPWFISMTPLTLLLMSFLYGWSNKNLESEYKFCIKAFGVGMAVEIIGVNTGLLFGEYTYGDVMGPKLNGVPLLMGLQWMLTILCTAHFTNYISEKSGIKLNSISHALLAGLLTTLFDVIIEPIAIDFDYWQWKGGDVPVFNYVCWFATSSLLHYFYKRYYNAGPTNMFLVVLFLAQVAFFSGLLIMNDNADLDKVNYVLRG